MANPETAAEPNTAAAIDFLKRWPTPFAQLTAIHIDPETHEKGRIEGRSFSTDELNNGTAALWIDSRQGKANLYFNVNALIEPTTKTKTAKGDMASVVAFHVDIDVPADEDQDSFVAGLLETIKTCAVEPSVVISSGGGVQAFWILQDPIVIDGDVSKAVEAERYTRFIEAQFSSLRGAKADACHNVDRIMRLPGTINVPDAKKLAKGRKPRLATLVSFVDLKYPLGQFQPASPKNESASKRTAQGSATASVDDPNEPPVTSLDDPRLKDADPDVMEALRTGRHPKHEAPGSRDFHVVCDLVRIGCSDKTIKTTWKVSPISKGCESWPRGFDREMDRIIQRARERAIDPDLLAMNEEHCVVKLGGKTRIMTWEDDELFPGRKTPSYSTVDDFCSFHSNRVKTIIRPNPKHDAQDPNSPENISKTMPIGTWWWGQRHRRQYNGITFAPHIDSDVAGGKLNLWTGFAVAAQEGNCSLYLAHLKENICRGNEEHYEYLIRVMANAVQHPERQGEVATVLLGKKGTGKTFAISQFGKLFGRHYLALTNSEQLTGKFNKHLQQCVVVLADECFFAGDRRDEQIIKTLITGEHLMVEPKGVDAYAARNCLHMFMATNQAWAVPATEDERRYFVLNVGEDKIQDSEYFQTILAQMESGGYEALLYLLKNMDLSGWNIRNVPKTDALREQQALTRRGMDAFIESVCISGILPCQFYQAPDVTLTVAGAGVEIIWEWLKEHYPEMRFTSPEALGRELAGWGAVHWRRHREGIRGRRFPPLAALREQFEAKHGPQEWPEGVTEWELSGSHGGDRNMRNVQAAGQADKVPF